MGIYYRYAASFLVLCIISLDATATVRVSAKSKAKDIISKPLESGFSLPNGAEAYYGRDKIFEIDNRINASAGSSIGPTVRPVPTSTVGNVSFPYGPNAAYPNGSGVQNPVIKVREKVKVPKGNISKALKNGLKANPGSLALTAAVSAAIAGVGWVMSEDNTKIQKKEQIAVAVETDPLKGEYSFKADNVTGQYSTALAACDAFRLQSTNYPQGTVEFQSPAQGVCVFTRPFDGAIVKTPRFIRTGTSCPSSSTYDSNLGGCFPAPNHIDITESDLDMLDPWLNQQSADWLGGLIRDVCSGSASPNACFEDMKDGGGFELSGPTSLQGPSTTKTTTSQNPDGSTSTRTDTSSTNYSFSYNNNNNTFDVDTKVTNTTTVDGKVTETSEQTDDTPAVDTPPEEETPEETYSFDDSPFPTVEPFYEVKYPDGLQGVWDSVKSQIDNSQFIEFLNAFVPSFSGSCPAFQLSFNIMAMANYGTISFQSLCYIFDFIKVIILVTAVFTFRALVFGG